jgi:nitrite reductase/ring-hydroxylating ferredoxin subunit
MADNGWIDGPSLADVPEATLTRVDLGDAAVLLYRSDTEVFAVSNRCTHAGMTLDRARVQPLGDDAMITCPAHGSRFSLRDGHVIRPPAAAPLPSYETRVVDGRVELRPR